MDSREGGLTRAGLLACLAVASLALGGPASAASGLLGMSLPADFRPFHPASPWNTPIGDDARVSSASGLAMARMEQLTGHLKADWRKWSIPLFVIDADTAPRATVSYSKEANPRLGPPEARSLSGLPIPDGVWPDPEDDAHMLLVDPKRRIAWDFSRLRRMAGRDWQASRIDVWDLDGMGARRPWAGPKWWTYGARGSGMPLIAGLVRPEEVRSGEIRHALVFASPLTRRSTLSGGPKEACPPASRSDGSEEGPETLPMGVRLQLDPALDLDALGLSPAARVIARAMQVYGLYNGDSTHNVFKIYLQNLGPDDDTWERMELGSLSRIPLARFLVLDCEAALK